MKHYRLAEVRWVDASIDTEDFDREDARKTKPVIRWTAGYLIEQTDDTLVLGTDFYEGEKEEFAAKMQIPWEMVLDWYLHPDYG